MFGAEDGGGRMGGRDRKNIHTKAVCISSHSSPIIIVIVVSIIIVVVVIIVFVIYGSSCLHTSQNTFLLLVFCKYNYYDNY